MKRTIGVMLAAAVMLFGAGRMASANQWGPTAYVYCGTEVGRGPTLIKPAGVVGHSCYLWMPGYGRVYGIWFLE
jgi:hypothetical protein